MITSVPFLKLLPVIFQQIYNRFPSLNWFPSPVLFLDLTFYAFLCYSAVQKSLMSSHYKLSFPMNIFIYIFVFMGVFLFDLGATPCNTHGYSYFCILELLLVMLPGPCWGAGEIKEIKPVPYEL